MRISLITLAFATLLPLAASATTYDAVSNFTSSNPSGPWTYGELDEPTVSNPSFTFTAFSSPASTSYGGYTYFGGLPLVGFNTANTPAYAQGATNTFYVPQTELWLHPGSGIGQDVAVEFTVPTSGYYMLTGEFTSRNNTPGEGNGVNVYVLLDGSSLGGESLNGQNGDSAPFSTGVPIYLDANDVLAFAVNNNGDYTYDSTGFDATFTTAATPEPSSLVFLGTGILGLAGTVHRRIRS